MLLQLPFLRWQDRTNTRTLVMKHLNTPTRQFRPHHVGHPSFPPAGLGGRRFYKLKRYAMLRMQIVNRAHDARTTSDF